MEYNELGETIRDKVQINTHLRWQIPCAIICDCGVGMNAIEADLDAWSVQHLALSKIHAQYLEDKEMNELVQEKTMRDVLNKHFNIEEGNT